MTATAHPLLPSRATPHLVARGFAVTFGMLGAALGATGGALALAGDALVPVDGSLAGIGGLTALAAGVGRKALDA